MNYTQEASGWVSATDLTKEEYSSVTKRLQQEALENLSRAQIKPVEEPKLSALNRNLGVMVEQAKEILAMVGEPIPVCSPKTIDSSHKIPVNLCPPSAIIAIALVIRQGHKKPGRTIYNWRDKRQSISYMEYDAAVERHLMKARDGEEFDEELSMLASDGEKDDQGNWVIPVRHSWAAMSGMAIMEDARVAGTLIDDRPIPGGASQFLNSITKEKK